MSEKTSVEEQATSQFERFLSELPSEIDISDEQAIRLAHARASALGLRQSKPRNWRATAMAASVLLAVFAGFYSLNTTTTSVGLPAELATEMDVILDENERELINDLEFYQWLSEVEAG